VFVHRSPRPQLKFNTLDKDGPKYVDRRSNVKTYDVIDGIPQNPIGRTGITGRGVLKQWGPNHAGLTVVTRYYCVMLFYTAFH